MRRPHLLSFLSLVLAVAAITLAARHINDVRTCQLCGYEDVVAWRNKVFCIGYEDGVAAIEPLERVKERCGRKKE